jgi:Family of unknown function (DUF5372)
VTYLGPEQRTRSVPIAWTDLATVDPFVTVAAGRAPFRLEDLIMLRALVGGSGSPGAAEGPPC